MDSCFAQWEKERFELCQAQARYLTPHVRHVGTLTDEDGVQCAGVCSRRVKLRYLRGAGVLGQEWQAALDGRGSVACLCVLVCVQCV